MAGFLSWHSEAVTGWAWTANCYNILIKLFSIFLKVYLNILGIVGNVMILSLPRFKCV